MRLLCRYLTPVGTQGFAPHYDDIEAFVLQTEGSKRWRLYDNPLGQVLPTDSSGNFDQKVLGPVILETTLHPGDLLYIPRGIVHQVQERKVFQQKFPKMSHSLFFFFIRQSLPKMITLCM